MPILEGYPEKNRTHYECYKNIIVAQQLYLQKIMVSVSLGYLSLWLINLIHISLYSIRKTVKIILHPYNIKKYNLL